MIKIAPTEEEKSWMNEDITELNEDEDEQE